MSDGSGETAPDGHASGRAPICRAPFVAMEFDPFGDVQACCANALYPLGNVTRSSLQEIWEGERAQALRAALSDGDLSLGCSVCHYRLAYGHGELPLEYYNNFPAPDGDLTWPYSLQFSLHNTCNLACVMCGADRSSSIRTQRSHLDPLPHAYGEAFFEQIVPFLEHAGAVDFSGGEPFLVREHERIWDLIIAMDRKPLCSLTTNGTVWNARTEHVLANLDTHVSVSVDGMTAATFESIRVGAKFDEVMANVERYLAYTRERGTILTMSWSLVRGNWTELADGARFAEARGIQLKVQTVIEPEFGLQRLPTPELLRVVEALEADPVVDELVLNRDMWLREVRRLRDELELRDQPGLRTLCMEPASPANVPHVVEMILAADDRVVPDAERDQVIERSLADLERWCSTERFARIELDRAGLIRSGDLDGALGALVDPLDVRPGMELAELVRAIETSLDGQVWIGDEWPEDDRLVQTIWIGRSVRDKVGLVLKVITIAGPEVITLLLGADAVLLSPSTNAVAVSLGSKRQRDQIHA